MMSSLKSGGGVRAASGSAGVTPVAAAAAPAAAPAPLAAPRDPAKGIPLEAFSSAPYRMGGVFADAGLGPEVARPAGQTTTPTTTPTTTAAPPPAPPPEPTIGPDGRIAGVDGMLGQIAHALAVEAGPMIRDNVLPALQADRELQLTIGRGIGQSVAKPLWVLAGVTTLYLGWRVWQDWDRDAEDDAPDDRRRGRR